MNTSKESAPAGDWAKPERLIREATEAAWCIQKNIDVDLGGIPPGDIWLTTIHAHANVIETNLKMLASHPAQSQSKAEAVGAEKAVEVLEGLKQRWEARRKQLLATGGHSPALEITNILLELRDEFEFHLNSLANPPQNPPENAKGEGK